MRTTLTTLALALPLLLGGVGCGGGTGGLQAVSGTVTFKGQPLDRGTIEFAPATPDLKSFSGAQIENGAYTVPADKGLAPGKYTVRVTSPEEKAAPKEAAPGESGPPARERIPAEFNSNTNLSFEVTAGGPNKFDVTIP